MDILISEDLQNPALEKLAKKFSVQRDGKLWEDAARLQTEIKDARVLIVRNQTQVTAKLMEAAPKLIGIGRVGVGLDNIDVPTATRLGIVVVAPLNANAVSVAELALGLILALARKIPEGDRSTKAGGWDRRGCTGIELDGRTLGLCGFGRIGGMVAARAKAFGMNLMVYDPVLKADSPSVVASGATYCAQLEDLLGKSDFVSLHLPLVPATKKLFNAKIFGAMKPGSYFINTSRGGVMDETGLIEALQKKHLAGAALDVREIEPPAAKGILETMSNVILTPHIGAFTIEAQTRTFEAVADDMERLLTGQSATNFVNIARPVPRNSANSAS
jgi:D-3-phosphoglycerate dehydrogenase / 2-oxoglutarate reductase